MTLEYSVKLLGMAFTVADSASTGIASDGHWSTDGQLGLQAGFVVAGPLADRNDILGDSLAKVAATL